VLVRLDHVAPNGFSPVLRELVRAPRAGARTRPIKLRRARVRVWREFIVRADEKLPAFVELEAVIRVISPPTQSSNSLLSFFDSRRALTIFQLPTSSNFKVKRKRDPELRA
jgi:hypothetical protein